MVGCYNITVSCAVISSIQVFFAGGYHNTAAFLCYTTLGRNSQLKFGEGSSIPSGFSVYSYSSPVTERTVFSAAKTIKPDAICNTRQISRSNATNWFDKLFLFHSYHIWINKNKVPPFYHKLVYFYALNQKYCSNN